MSEHFDIIVSGGGVAGLTAACLFGSAGYRVLCVDPSVQIIDRDAEGADLRSTAFLQPSIRVLERAGVWHRLASHAMPLQTMRIMDAGRETPTTRDFDASDVSELPFGWNLPNWLIRRELVARIRTLSNVDFRPGTGTERMLARTSGARLWLSDGTQVEADLVIAADGRNSPLRDAAGIDAKTTRYGQMALAFAVTHPIAHGNVSTEIHRSGGPFTLVPLPDHNGLPSSAVVWMENADAAQKLFELDEAAFEHAMSERSCHLLGPLTLASKRSLWPIISQLATRFSAKRLALVAEAAHVVPPIGAQGLNMSLADLQSLLDATLSVEDVGVFKPHASVYDMIEARFGCARNEVLFVSSNGWDAAGAAGYGFQTAWVNRAGEPMDRLYATPHHTLTDLTTIPDLI